MEFRILYKEMRPKQAKRSSEQLAASMAAVATIKDAFLNRKKVKVQGKKMRFTYVPTRMGPSLSDEPLPSGTEHIRRLTVNFNELEFVEITSE